VPPTSLHAAQDLRRRLLQASLHAKPTPVPPLHMSSDAACTEAPAPPAASVAARKAHPGPAPAQELGRRRLPASLHAKPTPVPPLHSSLGAACIGAGAPPAAEALSSQNPSRTPPRLCSWISSVVQQSCEVIHHLLYYLISLSLLLISSNICSSNLIY
jgi:hypothetical protein